MSSNCVADLLSAKQELRLKFWKLTWILSIVLLRIAPHLYDNRQPKFLYLYVFAVLFSKILNAFKLAVHV